MDEIKKYYPQKDLSYISIKGISEGNDQDIYNILTLFKEIAIDRGIV